LTLLNLSIKELSIPELIVYMPMVKSLKNFPKTHKILANLRIKL